MEVVRLRPPEYRLLDARFAEHGNSHRRMVDALKEANASAALERLRVLRRLERRLEIDLGSLCHRFLRREAPATHPLERMVLGYIACWRRAPGRGRELWVRVDRVRQLQSLAEGKLVGEPEP